MIVGLIWLNFILKQTNISQLKSLNLNCVCVLFLCSVILISNKYISRAIKTSNEMNVGAIKGGWEQLEEG